MIKPFLFLYCLLAVSLVMAEDQSVNVSVVTVDEVAYFPQGSAPATAVSLNDTTLSAQIRSSVMEIPVMVADKVDQGGVLVRLDCRDSKAEHRSNQARLSLAEYQLQRAVELSKDKHVSEEILRTRKSEIVMARSAVSISATNVERCVVRAPFNGVVAQRLADTGEWVNQGEPLIQLVELDNVEVSAQLADLYVNELRAIPQFDFVVAGQRFPLKLRTIADVVNSKSRTREIRLQFTGARAAPGQSGRLVWQQAQRYLPANFLVKRDAQYGVFIAQDGRAKFVSVPDAQEGRPVRIELQDDVQLIDSGRQAVRDNDLINIRR